MALSIPLLLTSHELGGAARRLVRRTSSLASRHSVLRSGLGLPSTATAAVLRGWCLLFFGFVAGRGASRHSWMGEVMLTGTG